MKKWLLVFLLAAVFYKVDAQLIDMDLELSDNVIEVTDPLAVQGTITNNSLLTFTDELILAYHLDIIDLPFPPAPIIVIDTIELATPFLPGNQIPYSKDISPGLPEYTYALGSMNIITIWPIVDMLPIGPSSYFRDSVLVLPEGALDTTDATTSVLNLTSHQEIRLFPNPASSYMKMDLRNTEPRPFILKLIGFDGKTMLETTITGGLVESLDISNLLPGIYMAYLSEMDGRPVANRKFVVMGSP